MTPHGPDSVTFEKASSEELKPVRVAEGTMGMLQYEIIFFLSNHMRLKLTSLLNQHSCLNRH